MAMQKTKPAPKKMVVAKKTAATAGKPKTTVTAKKVVAKKTATPVAKPKNAKTPAVKKAAAPAKAVAAKAKPAAKKIAANPGPEERYRMVETAAYFIAERHGFQGDSTEHWAAAEKEIAEKLR